MRRKENIKLSKRYYRPFRVFVKRNEVTYALQLPPTSKLHSVFYVLTKEDRGDPSLIVKELPNFDEEGKMLIQPSEALDYQVIKRGRKRKKVW